MTSLQVAVLAINLLCALFIFADLCVTLFKTDIFTHANQEKIILNCQTDCKQLISVHTMRPLKSTDKRIFHTLQVLQSPMSPCPVIISKLKKMEIICLSMCIKVFERYRCAIPLSLSRTGDGHSVQCLSYHIIYKNIKINNILIMRRARQKILYVFIYLILICTQYRYVVRCVCPICLSV